MKQKRYLYLNDTESSVILQSLIRLKNSLIRQGRYTDCVDELILKLMDAPTKRVVGLSMILDSEKEWIREERRRVFDEEKASPVDA